MLRRARHCRPAANASVPLKIDVDKLRKERKEGVVPWHPSAPHYDPRSAAAACPCSRSYPVIRRPQRLKWPCLAPAPFSKNDPRSTATACPRSRSYPVIRRRNFQSPAAVPLLIGLLGTPRTPPCRAATLTARPPPATAPDPDRARFDAAL